MTKEHQDFEYYLERHYGQSQNSMEDVEQDLEPARAGYKHRERPRYKSDDNELRSSGGRSHSRQSSKHHRSGSRHNLRDNHSQETFSTSKLPPEHRPHSSFGSKHSQERSSRSHGQRSGSRHSLGEKSSTHSARQHSHDGLEKIYERKKSKFLYSVNFVEVYDMLT